MIKVCDAIMGSGKSSAAITYMNEHPDRKFIYITPYLDEAARIKKACPALHFVEPSNKIPQYHFTKNEHTAALISQGRNIATTHQAFKLYTEEMLESIRKFEYTLIIDENLNILEKYDCHPDDIEILVNGGYVQRTEDSYSLTGKSYEGYCFRELFKFMKVRELIKIESKSESEKETLYYWLLPPNLITSFKDVFVLTYLFKGQGIYYFLEMYNLPYEYIGIEKCRGGQYRFGSYPGYTPEYVSHLKDMVNIMDNEKLNSIGDSLHSLSINWFDKKTEEVEQLKKNVYNYINNIWRGVPSNEKLWGCYPSYEHDMKAPGYTRSFLTFNTRATNKYRNRRYLIYIVNLFMNVAEKQFYMKHGLKVDESAYALSIMIQWIWRSAIRDGDKIDIYVPSKRMRNLLINWINDVSRGGDIIAS